MHDTLEMVIIHVRITKLYKAGYLYFGFLNKLSFIPLLFTRKFWTAYLKAIYSFMVIHFILKPFVNISVVFEVLLREISCCNTLFICWRDFNVKSQEDYIIEVMCLALCTEQAVTLFTVWDCECTLDTNLNERYRRIIAIGTKKRVCI